MTIAGRLTVETFLKDFHFDDTWTFGSPRPLPATPPVRAVDLVAAEVAARNLRSLGGADPMVLLAPVEAEGELAVVTARNGVEWRQHLIPLETPIDRVAGTPTGSTQTVTATLTSPGLAGQKVLDRFAPGSFITLTAAESLNGPTYDDLPAGLKVTGTTCRGQCRALPTTTSRSCSRSGRDTLPGVHAACRCGLRFAFSAGALAMVQERDRAAYVANLVTPR